MTPLDVVKDIGLGFGSCPIVLPIHAFVFKHIEEALGRRVVRAAAIIEDDVSIGAGAIILPAVRIGAGAMIAAGAVVKRDVRPDGLVKGMPAKADGHATESAVQL